MIWIDFVESSDQRVADCLHSPCGFFNERSVTFNLSFFGLHIVVERRVNVARSFNEGVTYLRLAQVLDLVPLRIVDESRPSTEPFVETGIAMTLLKLLKL